MNVRLWLLINVFYFRKVPILFRLWKKKLSAGMQYNLHVGLSVYITYFEHKFLFTFSILNLRWLPFKTHCSSLTSLCINKVILLPLNAHAQNCHTRLAKILYYLSYSSHKHFSMRMDTPGEFSSFRQEHDGQPSVRVPRGNPVAPEEGHRRLPRARPSLLSLSVRIRTLSTDAKREVQ